VVRLEVQPGSPSLRRPPFYVTHNISVSGMFLITSDPLPENTRLKLNFQIPGDSEKIQVLGEVVWCREKDENSPYFPGMGIRFLGISDRDRAIIDRFIQELIEEKTKGSSA